MPRPQLPPNYLKHRVGKKVYARTKLFGQEVPLGPWGSEESYKKLEEVRARWRAIMAAGGPNGAEVMPAPKKPTVAELVAAWLRHVEEDDLYLKDGEPTSERAAWKITVAPLIALHGGTIAEDFGPKCLKQVRAAIVTGAWLSVEEALAYEHLNKTPACCRNTANQRTARIVRMFRWAAGEELVPETVHRALACVEAIPAGSKGAVDHQTPGPVHEQDFKDTLPCLARRWRAMALLQWLTGMRPGEVCAMRREWIDTNGLMMDGKRIWVYRPLTHKTEGKGIIRQVALSPAAQVLLKPYLAGVGDWVFPAGSNAADPDGHVSEGSYGRVVRLACERAGVPPWSPNQIRKASLTVTEEGMDLDHARAQGGHTTAGTTKRFYARGDLKKAAEAAAKLG